MGAHPSRSALTAASGAASQRRPLSGRPDAHSRRACHSDGLRSRDPLETCTSSVAARVALVLALAPLAVVVAALLVTLVRLARLASSNTRRVSSALWRPAFQRRCSGPKRTDRPTRAPAR